MYKQTGASYWSVSRIKVSGLEWILPIETEGIGNWPLHPATSNRVGEEESEENTVELTDKESSQIEQIIFLLEHF